ncbi:MAG TPA: hypothetical protein ENI98_06705 [Gammaproteobacteria bacterium]|nr:hypothetical protein [Gammaproteobacteria bacterium]
MKTKKLLPLDEAATGMALAQEVLDVNGFCLLAAATRLTAVMLNSLKQRGIKNIVIWEEHDLDEEASRELIRAQREACVSALEHRFRQVPDDANMQRLKETLLAYRLQELS